VNIHHLASQPGRFAQRGIASRLRRVLRLFLCFPALIILLVPAVFAAAPGARTAAVFLPFTVELPGSYSYLGNALSSTLATRIAARAPIAPIAHGAAAEQLTRALKAGDHAAFNRMLDESKAEALVMGVLAPEGGQFGLTCYVFSKNRPAPEKFQQHFQSVDDAMTAVDRLAADISTSVFSAAPEDDAMAGSSGRSVFRSAHPERAYREGKFSAAAIIGLEYSGKYTLVSHLRSKAIPAEAMDMNAGDLDGDGIEEILLLTSNALVIYRNDAGQFRMLATIPLPKHLRYQSLDLGDINQNGRLEMYVSGSNGDTPSSSAFEWDGKKITVLFRNAPWYLRTLSATGASTLLLGQKNPADEIGEGSTIFYMSLDKDNALQKGEKLVLQKGLTLYDFALGDINADGADEIIAIGPDSRLFIYAADGTPLWKSTATFGASNNFFGTLTSPNNTITSDKPTLWVRTRIVVADLDADGINDILIGNNQLETVTFMPNLRYFTGSALIAFTWQGDGLGRLWESRKIPGYMTNYQLVPSSTAGEYRIYFAESVSNYPFLFWRSPSVTLNSYTLRVN
jgi:hypothetical protein